MKRYIVLVAVVLAILVATFKAFGQNQGRAGQAEQRRNIRQRWENMSEAEREKFREEMRKNRQKWENMSDEERAKLRDQMRQRFSSRPQAMGRDEQIKSIKAIELQVAKLKAAVEVMTPEDRSRLRELPEEERTKLREKMMTAMRDRQTAIRTIEQELGKLRAPGRPAAESQARISELRAIHKLALKEKATQTAGRLEKLIAGYQRESQGRFRPPAQRPREGEPRTRRQRPLRQEKTE
jgi:uncharacterized membrane protein